MKTELKIDIRSNKMRLNFRQLFDERLTYNNRRRIMNKIFNSTSRSRLLVNKKYNNCFFKREGRTVVKNYCRNRKHSYKVISKRGDITPQTLIKGFLLF